MKIVEFYENLEKARKITKTAEPGGVIGGLPAGLWVTLVGLTGSGVIQGLHDFYVCQNIGGVWFCGWAGWTP